MNLNINLILSSFLIYLFNNFLAVDAKLKDGECEVCVKLITRFTEQLDSNTKSKPELIEKEFVKFCEGVRGKDERFCYYVGGLKTSATKILNEITKPISSSYPPEKICEKLKKIDSQTCELKYDKQIDLSKADLKKLKVKDLKRILSDWGEDKACRGCAEKSDFIKVIKELMPKYAPEAAKARQEL